MLFQIVITLGVLAQVGVFAIDDRILERASNGTSVVLLTVAYLQQTTIFSDDNGMLRRIAYVETRDGARLSENYLGCERGGAAIDAGFRPSDSKRQAQSHFPRTGYRLDRRGLGGTAATTVLCRGSSSAPLPRSGTAARCERY